MIVLHVFNMICGAVGGWTIGNWIFNWGIKFFKARALKKRIESANHPESGW